MRRPETIAVAALLLLTAGCVSPNRHEPGLPGDLLRSDSGTLTGAWRNGRGLVVTIDLNIGTFAARSGCTQSGGRLIALGGDRFRIDRYGNETHSTEECGPWRNGPAIAPFDGVEIGLVRAGNRLAATGPDGAVTLDRVVR